MNWSLVLRICIIPTTRGGWERARARESYCKHNSIVDPCDSHTGMHGICWVQYPISSVKTVLLNAWTAARGASECREPFELLESWTIDVNGLQGHGGRVPSLERLSLLCLCLVSYSILQRFMLRLTSCTLLQRQNANTCKNKLALLNWAWHSSDK